MKTLSTTLGLVLMLSGVAHGDEYIPLEQINPMGPQSEQELIWGTIQPLECGIERVVPLDALMNNYFLPNGLEAFEFDTNNDGVLDVAMLLPQGDENRYPAKYYFDRDYDGDPDIIYHDTKRDGTCGGIEPEWIGDGVNGEKGREI